MVKSGKKFPSSTFTGSELQKQLAALKMIYDLLGEILQELIAIREGQQ